MNLMPDKHVSLGSSILGVGATILRKLDKPSTITGLWTVAGRQRKSPPSNDSPRGSASCSRSVPSALKTKC